ncbi:MAG: lysine--tRNA ligase [bacterium]
MAMLETIKKERIEKIEAFRKKGIDPFATKSKRDTMADDIVKDYSKYEGKSVVVAGRLMSFRDFGKIAFSQLKDGSGSVQLYLKQDVLKNWDDLKLFDVGDIVDAGGKVTKTKTREISVEVEQLDILTKAIRPLPEKWEGLKVVEERYRKRYLDILLNEESKKRLVARANIVKAIREFLWGKGFVEVDTPILQPMYGGTNAKPFTTHVDSLGMTAYLAIANELYLKRVIVGGIENVFTIGRLFRNEGVDKSHNPEFAMLETMSAYQNYEYNMDLTEDMYKYICDKVFGKYTFKIAGQDVDFSKKWSRIKIVDYVKKKKKLDFDKMTLEEANKELKKVDIESQESVGEALIEYFEKVLGPTLIQPTIVYGHPVEISPLCKRIPGDEKYVERFEVYIAGMETGDNWTELNDPIELYDRFKADQEREDAHPNDMEFVEAMEYGMAPTTGLGPGIERVAMMLTETENIDDIIWFPLMKPKK